LEKKLQLTIAITGKLRKNGKTIIGLASVKLRNGATSGV